jgi:hypothetical protein
MRSLLALALLVALGGFANAAAMHHRHKHHHLTSRGEALAPPPDLYCLQGRIWGYPGNCQFSDYAQCMATASGTDAFCDKNPVYLFAEQRRGYGAPR